MRGGNRFIARELWTAAAASNNNPIWLLRVREIRTFSRVTGGFFYFSMMNVRECLVLRIRMRKKNGAFINLCSNAHVHYFLLLINSYIVVVVVLKIDESF